MQDYISKTLEEFDKLDAICNVCKTGLKQFLTKALENQKKEIKKEFMDWFNNSTEDVEDVINRILK